MEAPARVPVIPLGSLIPCCACLCCVNSFMCYSPESVGCYTKYGTNCLQYQHFCCKYTSEPGYDFIFCRTECMKGTSRSCFQVENQCCCIDFRCQDHKSEEQPCICTTFFFTCYYKDQRSCYCCGNMDSLDAQIGANGNAVPPVVQVQYSGPQSAHRPNGHSVSPEVHTLRSSPRPASGYSPTYIASIDRSSSGEPSPSGRYTPVSYPPPPPTVVATSIASAPSYVPEARVVYGHPK